jgi:hypothetical protein
MNLTAEQIQSNWVELLAYIDKYISDPRKEKLREFYEKYAERLIVMPAAHKKEYHNAFPGGYVEHVLRVIRCALKQYDLWKSEGADVDKMGDEVEDSYIPQTDQWRKDKLGEDYMFNVKVPFSSVPDRGLFMLQSHGIQYSFNEMLAIQTHDGLYDEGNKKYLMTFMPEQKPRTSLPFILHQADLMAARIEFEREWLPKLKEGKKSVDVKKENFTLGTKPNTSKKTSTKEKALGSFKSDSLKNLLDNI